MMEGNVQVFGSKMEGMRNCGLKTLVTCSKEESKKEY